MTEGIAQKRYIFPEVEKALKEYGQPIHYSDLAELIGLPASNVCSSLALQVRSHPRGSVRRVGRGTYEYVGRGRKVVAIVSGQPTLDEDVEPDDLADAVDDDIRRADEALDTTPAELDDVPLRGRDKMLHSARLRRITRLMQDLTLEFSSLDREMQSQKRKADAWDKLQDTVKQLEIRERHQ